MNPINQNQLIDEEFEHIRYDVFREVSSQDGPLSKNLRTRLNSLPRHIRKQLVEAEYNGCSSLFTACCKGNVEIAEYLITKCDANIEQRGILFDYADRKDEEFEDYTVHNVTPLCAACGAGHLHLVKCLVRLGCNVNAVSGIGSSALEVACTNKDLEIVQYLVENGANIRKPSFDGATYLIDSIESAPICSYLIRKGADVNARDVYDKTALHYAVESLSYGTIRLLLDHGADPFARSRYGDDPLQLACITGSLEVVEYLLSRINYPRERWIEAIELMGSTLIHFHYDTQDVLLHWRLAYDARTNKNNNIQERSQIPPRPAYGNMVEFATIDELNASAWDVDALRMQGLLIQERLLGIDHKVTLHRLMERGDFYKVTRRYQVCIDLWMLALRVRVQKHTILHSDTCDTVRAIVKLMVNLMDDNDPMVPQFKDAYTMFQLLTSNIHEIQQLLSIQPVDRSQQKNYDCILRCLLHLMCILLSVAKTKDDHKLIESSVLGLVLNNIRSVQTNETLLHMSVSNMGLMKSDYFTDEVDTKRFFPNLPVTKLLLDCGAPVNARDNTRSTPLLLAAYPFNYEKDVIHTLIEHGAHLDLPNLLGDRPSSMLRRISMNDICLGQQISLKCLSANVIVKSGVSYRNEVPRMLEDFIRAHEMF
ncbi:protein fem-1 homolog C-like [Toxorhynchites rutilus septentrionalis]|uniref:protein fem-1 homolog C-like n=1 Tax=Toxorhynchites rutilus septentrionalis TaxID=329112 RepID=UPI002478E4CE|nr:protein fem-1 homolog C-like [Toxorhynchites rutilus septentrionalis]